MPINTASSFKLLHVQRCLPVLFSEHVYILCIVVRSQFLRSAQIWDFQRRRRLLTGDGVLIVGSLLQSQLARDYVCSRGETSSSYPMCTVRKVNLHIDRSVEVILPQPTILLNDSTPSLLSQVVKLYDKLSSLSAQIAVYLRLLIHRTKHVKLPVCALFVSSCVRALAPKWNL